MLAAGLFAEDFQVFEESQAGPGGPARAVLVSHRIAETHEKPLLVALYDRPVKLAHRLLACLLETPQQLGLILRFERQIRLGFE